MDPMGRPETIVKNWQRTFHNIRKERRPLLVLCLQHWKKKILAAINLKNSGKKGKVVTYRVPTRVSKENKKGLFTI